MIGNFFFFLPSVLPTSGSPDIFNCVPGLVLLGVVLWVVYPFESLGKVSKITYALFIVGIILALLVVGYLISRQVLGRRHGIHLTFTLLVSMMAFGGIPPVIVVAGSFVEGLFRLNKDFSAKP